MDINEVMTLVGSYAFPIVMCVFLIVKFDKTLDILIDEVLEKKEDKEK